MTTPIPIYASKRNYNINVQLRTYATSRYFAETTYNLLAGTYQLVAGGYNLTVPGIENVVIVTAGILAAPKRNYHIIAPERNNG
jgi:hypothetical protein